MRRRVNMLQGGETASTGEGGSAPLAPQTAVAAGGRLFVVVVAVQRPLRVDAGLHHNERTAHTTVSLDPQQINNNTTAHALTCCIRSAIDFSSSSMRPPISSMRPMIVVDIWLNRCCCGRGCNTSETTAKQTIR